MESELIKIFDEDRNPIGVATREEVHKNGYWHETFHCWLIQQEKDQLYVYLQLRSPVKKDYPTLLDITAAGHILSHETVEDGIREIKEEIGIDVNMEELISVGVIDYSVIKGEFIDKELAHVYLCKGEFGFKDFTIQREEVSGIYRVTIDDFEQLWLGNLNEVPAIGFEESGLGERMSIDKSVTKADFVPHEKSYYEKVIRSIRKLV
ncbi:NUDIX domain-containing protein [Bacillus luteolus]|uniref:NUDIX domain-containing protein n=1 Tax=Litchfieldia luteola TaxID=682179 RepID=A0ABR9QG85_9BACI|nr:NUDIX domain-containing protein [Cytobacillus luteolus]MBE4907512.1 NUDIX domain-containing protein [Cytobacillus luteolus]MBP1944280.1 isopentenyldiphosphate isomerase [Cytobacillus luteolus]